MSARKLWAGVDESVQAEAIKDLVSIRGTDDWPPYMDGMIAEAINFRVTTLRQAEPDRFARHLRRAFGRLDDEETRNLLALLHWHARSELLTDVYDALGVEHDGVATDQDSLDATVDPDAGIRRIPSVVKKHGLARVQFCLQVIDLFGHPGWDEAVHGCLQAIVPEPETPPAADTAKPLDDEAEDESGDGRTDAPSARAFTALDRVIIRTIIGSLNNVEGSEELDALDDLVQEVLELNDARPESFFHRGYLDALMGREIAPKGPGINVQRRAWYLVGYVQGQLRQLPDREVAARLTALDEADKSVLLKPERDEAGYMLAPLVIPLLLEQGATGEAIDWLKAHITSCGPQVIDGALDWARKTLIDSEPEIAGSVLMVIHDHLGQLSERFGNMPSHLHRSLMRRIAVVRHRQGRMTDAESIIDSLLADCDDDLERGKLLGRKILIRLGVRSLENFELPPEATREPLLAGIEAQVGLLRDYARLEPASPVVRLALAMRVVGQRNSGQPAQDDAEQQLRKAICGMVANDEAFWTMTGVLRRARFYLSVLELRRLDQGLAQAAVARLISLDDIGTFPVDLIEEALSHAALQDARGTSELARMALEGNPQRMLACLDIRGLARRSRPFRESVEQAIGLARDRLSARERWDAWLGLARGALEADVRDVPAARRALDQAETTAHSAGHPEWLVDLVQGDGADALDPAWGRRECREALVTALVGAGREHDALTELLATIHDAVTNGESDVRSLIEYYLSLGGSKDDLEQIERRLAVEDDQLPPTGSARSSTTSVRVLFVGGNEVQEAYREYVEQAIKERFGHRVSVDFAFTGWSSNWGRMVKRMECRLKNANALVLMRFVRTELGRTMRRRADDVQIPWIPCTGHGRASMERAIATAVRVAESLPVPAGQS